MSTTQEIEVVHEQAQTQAQAAPNGSLKPNSAQGPVAAENSAENGGKTTKTPSKTPPGPSTAGQKIPTWKKVLKLTTKKNKKKKIEASLQALSNGVEDFKMSLNALIEAGDSYSYLRDLVIPVNTLHRNIHMLKASFERDLLRLKSNEPN